MRHVTFYHKDTGLLNALTVLVSDDKLLDLNTPVDHVPIDHPEGGLIDHLSQRVDLERVKAERESHAESKPFRPSLDVLVDHRPPQPSPDHEWNATARRWTLSAAAQEHLKAARAKATRLAQLIEQQHPLTRRLAINPGDDSARQALAAIDAEIHLLSEKTSP